MWEFAISLSAPIILIMVLMGYSAYKKAKVKKKRSKFKLIQGGKKGPYGKSR